MVLLGRRPSPARASSVLLYAAAWKCGIAALLPRGGFAGIGNRSSTETPSASARRRCVRYCGACRPRSRRATVSYVRSARRANSERLRRSACLWNRRSEFMRRTLRIRPDFVAVWCTACRDRRCRASLHRGGSAPRPVGGLERSTSAAQNRHRRDVSVRQGNVADMCPNVRGRRPRLGGAQPEGLPGALTLGHISGTPVRRRIARRRGQVWGLGGCLDCVRTSGTSGQLQDLTRKENPSDSLSQRTPVVALTSLTLGHISLSRVRSAAASRSHDQAEDHPDHEAEHDGDLAADPYRSTNVVAD